MGWLYINNDWLWGGEDFWLSVSYSDYSDSVSLFFLFWCGFFKKIIALRSRISQVGMNKVHLSIYDHSLVWILNPVYVLL